MYCFLNELIQHCLMCSLFDSTVSEDSDRTQDKWKTARFFVIHWTFYVRSLKSYTHVGGQKCYPQKSIFYFCSFVSAPSFFFVAVSQKSCPALATLTHGGEISSHFPRETQTKRQREAHLSPANSGRERAQDSTFALQVQIELLSAASLFSSSFPC